MRQKIIISRTDNIGDLVLTLPMASLIKQFIADANIVLLCRNYSTAVARYYRDIDQIITLEALTDNDADTIAAFKEATTIIHVSPNHTVAKLAKRYNIAQRIGTNRRWYHWFNCNQLVNLSRRKAEQHEALLNLMLLKPMDITPVASLDELVPSLNFRKPPLPESISKLFQQHQFNLVIHPMTNGNTYQWPLTNFIELVNQIAGQCHVIITGTEHDKAALAPLIASDCCSTVGKLSLDELVSLLAHCDGVIANSTGPLHIAASLGTQVLGLYPNEQGKNIQRWLPLGKRVSFFETAPTDCLPHDQRAECMRDIKVTDVVAKLQQWLER